MSGNVKHSPYQNFSNANCSKVVSIAIMNPNLFMCLHVYKIIKLKCLSRLSMYVVREACDTKGNWRALLPIKEAAIRILTITQ